MNKREQLAEPLCLIFETGEKFLSAGETMQIKNNVGGRSVEAFGYQPSEVKILE